MVGAFCCQSYDLQSHCVPKTNSKSIKSLMSTSPSLLESNGQNSSTFSGAHEPRFVSKYVPGPHTLLKTKFPSQSKYCGAKMQSSLSKVALGSKLQASSDKQPAQDVPFPPHTPHASTKTHDPSSSEALMLKLHAMTFVQP